MAWLAVSLFFHACILFPAIVIINAMAGNSLTLLIISISSLMLMFVTNLSQMPEKIIIPAIFLSVLIDLLIIIICLIHGIDPSLLYKR